MDTRNVRRQNYWQQGGEVLMKYKKGDKVLIVNHRTRYMASSGAMDKYLNTVMTIRKVNELDYNMEEDEGWYWSYEEIVGKVVGNRVIKYEI